MYLPLIILGGGLAAIGLLMTEKKKGETDEKVLTDKPETSKKAGSTSKKRANDQNDETINDNENDSNLNGGRSANVDDLGELENED